MLVLIAMSCLAVRVLGGGFCGDKSSNPCTWKNTCPTCTRLSIETLTMTPKTEKIDPNGAYVPGADITISATGTVNYPSGDPLSAGSWTVKFYEIGRSEPLITSVSGDIMDAVSIDGNKFTMTVYKGPGPEGMLNLPDTGPGGTQNFTIEFFGNDQDHANPWYVEMDYTFSPHSTEPSLVAAAPIEPPITVSAQNGNMTVDVTAVKMRTTDGTFSPGAVATVYWTGTIPSKQIIAGTFKYQVWEEFVTHFVYSGNVPYFKCDQRGCDPSRPIALNIENPVSTPTTYQATVKFTMPKARKTGHFSLVLWGEDQDHSPYDCTISIGYNFTSTV